MNIEELSEKLKNNEITSLEITKEYLSKIKKIDPQIKSYITVSEESALKEAEESDNRRKNNKTLSVLDGIPIAIKDNILTSAILTTAGSKMLENFIPPFDATVVKKLKNLGVVILGKTNMDEWAMGSSTESSYFGTTKNPWDLSRVPGGSSGGSAAAVSADLAVATIGEDTGGSIRQPASLCGIVGFKPTYGTVSRYGLIAMVSSFDQIGPMTKTAKDAEILFDAISGHDEMDATSSRIKGPEAKTSKLKLGIPKEYFVKGIEKGTEKIIQDSIKKFEKAGYKIEKITLPYTKYALPVYYTVMPAEATSNLSRFDGIRYGYSESIIAKSRTNGFGPEAKRRIMLGNYILSAGYFDAYYLKAKKVQRLIKEDFDKAFKKVDFILTPVSPTTAFKIGEKMDNPVQMYLSDIFTPPINLAGLPAISIPAGLDKGLPVGLQIIGPQFSDKGILKLAQEFEKLRGNWKGPKI
jgi:aspartyl-tRNA(Asn)/glutamyl-tRNA(Gln) amidotransferase subunit A